MPRKRPVGVNATPAAFPPKDGGRVPATSHRLDAVLALDVVDQVVREKSHVTVDDYLGVDHFKPHDLDHAGPRSVVVDHRLLSIDADFGRWIEVCDFFPIQLEEAGWIAAAPPVQRLLLQGDDLVLLRFIGHVAAPLMRYRLTRRRSWNTSVCHI